MIIEWIKLNIFKVMLIALVASIALNVFAFTWKGIVVNKTYTTNNHQEQLQYQGQLIIQNWASQGDVLVWKDERFVSFNDAMFKKQLLPPQYSIPSDIIYDPNISKWILIYPEFMRKK